MKYAAHGESKWSLTKYSWSDQTLLTQAISLSYSRKKKTEKIYMCLLNTIPPPDGNKSEKSFC